MPRKVYKFWCEPADADSLAVLDEQMQLAREYRWTLANLENAMRDELRTILRQDLTYRDADDQITTLYDVAKKDRDDVWEDALARTKKERSRIGKLVRATHEYIDAVATLREQKREYDKSARNLLGPKGRGMGFGTSQINDDSHAQSVQTTDFTSRVRVSVRPGEGTCCVHLQNASVRTFGQVLEGLCNTITVSEQKYALAPRVGHERWRDISTERVDGQRLQRVTLKFSKHGQPASVHALLHRAIPTDAKVSHARIHAVKIGTKRRWSLQFVVDEATRGHRLDENHVKRAIVGVDLGFRHSIEDGGYIVATACEPDGLNHQKLVVPFDVGDRAINRDLLENPRWVAIRAERSRLLQGICSETGSKTPWKLPKSHVLAGSVSVWKAEDKRLKALEPASKCSDLRSIRDLHLDEIKVILTKVRESAPEWFRVDTQALHAWRSPPRVVRLWRRWKDRRWEGDDSSFEALLAWKKQDQHLWDWEASNRIKMRRQIDGLYQRWASDLAKSYEVVKIENLRISTAAFDWRAKAAQNYLEDSKESKQTVLDRRAGLSLAHLQKCLKERGATFGTSVGTVDKAYTSCRCSSCGHTNKKSEGVMLTCSRCKFVEHRDLRAAKNIASGEVLSWVAGPLAAPKDAKRKNPRRKVKTIDAQPAV